MNDKASYCRSILTFGHENMQPVNSMSTRWKQCEKKKSAQWHFIDEDRILVIYHTGSCYVLFKFWRGGVLRGAGGMTCIFVLLNLCCSHVCMKKELLNKKIKTMLTLKVLVTTINAQWEGMWDVGSARYEPALLPPCPAIRVLSYSS